MGTPEYIAPEIFPFMFTDEDLQYTVAVDIWSLRCVFFQFLTRRSPFTSMRTLGAYYRLKRKFPTDTLLEHGVRKDGVNILLEMMNPYPADRITATEASSRPWTCVQELEVAISTHPSIEKDFFESR